MMHPREAREAILSRIRASAAAEEPSERVERVPIAEALGRRLAREVLSDVDLPPFEKSAMDGFALRSADAAEPGAKLRLVGESRAGAPFGGEVPAGSCVEIYTGAEVPADCDAVEMVEHAHREVDHVIFERAVRPAANVGHTGEILARGRAALAPPRRLSPLDLAVLAAVGCDPVPVLRRPRVSIVTTGDELVPVRERPGPGQIREGNTVQLRAACLRLGCEVVRSGIVRDDPSALETAFRAALEDSDALVTTGGVSVGRYDLVGAALEAVGVEPLVHKVAIKPGKPIWFGMRGAKPVLGLPGNPVSSLLGFEVFVRPALALLAGGGPEETEERLRSGRWVGSERTAGGRQENLPVRAREGEDGVARLEPLPWKGSADIVSLAAADGFAVLEAGATARPEDLLPWRPLERA